MPETIEQPPAKQQVTPQVQPQTPPSEGGYSDPTADLESMYAKPEPVEEPVVADPDPSITPQEPSETPKEGGETPGDGKPPVEEPKGVGRPAGTAKELRQALDNYKKEVQTLKGELEKVKKTRVEDPEKKSILDRLNQIEKEKQEIEGELKFANYKKTPEFREKYHIPLENAFESAYSDVKQLVIENAETGENRMATEADFDKLLNLPLNQAIKQAKEWFGDAYNLVIGNRQKIWEIRNNSQRAIETFQKQASEREKAQQIEQSALAEKAQSIWEGTIAEQIEKFPQFFAPVEGDEEINTRLGKAQETVDFVFSGKAQSLPLDQKVKLQATIRNKAIGFDKLAIENKRMAAKVAELEKKLAGFQKSAPGGGAPQVDKVESDDWNSELDKVFSK